MFKYLVLVKRVNTAKWTGISYQEAVWPRDYEGSCNSGAGTVWVWYKINSPILFLICSFYQILLVDSFVWVCSFTFRFMCGKENC